MSSATTPGGRVLEQWYVAPNSGARRPGRTTASPSAPASVHRKYHYGPSGHLDFVEDSMRGSARFVHDLLGRLQAAIPTQGLAELFEYDAGGNRRHTARLPSARLKDPESMLVRGSLGPDTLDLAELHAQGAQVEERLTAQGNRTLHLSRPGEHLRYEYDAQGRLARKHVDQDSAEGTATWTYEWNALGQLRGVVRPDGERWSYDYDAMGRRVAKHGPRGTHRYVWDDARLLHEVTPSQQRVTFLTHPEQATPLLRADDTATFYALHDALGSTSEWVTEDGSLAWSARRGSWGEPLEETFDGAPGFPGQSYDAESGLYYNFARYYDPVLGRYISPDPIGVLGGFNDYAYVPSPVEWMDVLGLYTTGGPFQWSPAATSGSGAPDLLGQGQRYVINPATGNRHSESQRRSLLTMAG
ncbi:MULTISPECIES: RHS repeat domain-containing protein [unclassified Myxococcus]|uniref:RHS repeat domain-containing protein n=1 Tax=unclassified Myxococcus TaxID=2648731 RepID=UPI00272E3830|nr:MULTISPECIES: RHS repeat-associated core domain-containing protein [unclassified Myxococcus]